MQRGGAAAMRLTILLALAIAPVIASGAEPSFLPEPSIGQSVRYERGTPLLYAETSKAALLLAINVESKKRAALWVGVLNRSDTPFNVDERNVSISHGASALHVYSSADRQKMVAKAARMRAIGAALAAASSGYAAGTAGYSTHTGTVSANGTTASFSGSTYDSNAALAAQQRANAQTAATARQAKALNEADRAALDGRVLLTQTLDPGQALTGDILFDLPKVKRGQPITIEVSLLIDGEPVTAKFNGN